MLTRSITVKERRWGGAAAIRLALVGVLIATAGQIALATPAGAKAPSQYYVESTGHILGEPFLRPWADNGGLEWLGLPVTEPVENSDGAVQYFQFGYLADTAKSQRQPRIARAMAGQELLEERHDPDRMVAGRRIGGERTASAFIRDAGADRGSAFLLEKAIAAIYDELGGDERFGSPLSHAYVAYGVHQQWFEFGRLQWSADEADVVVAAVGFELARARGIDVDPVDRGNAAVFDARRFRTFRGDGTIPEARGAFDPVRIMIPKIGIDAAIEQIGITDGVMDVPADAWNVGWYPTFSRPGEWTNVVMSGHKDWWGVGPAVFWNLERLAPGDKIYLVGSDGRGSTYVVVELFAVDANANAKKIVGDIGVEALTLITCGGDFNGVEYLSRVIVQAERI
jgi:LPXTG-site transpeptidase (sortase) family protein